MKRNYINIISIFFMLQSANFTQTAQTERLVRIIDVIKALPKNNANPEAEAARKAQEEKARAASARKEKIRILYERAAAAHERVKARRRERENFAFLPSNFRQISERFAEELRALNEEKMIFNEINALALEIEERNLFEQNLRAHLQRYDEYLFSKDKFEEARRRYEDDARRRAEEEVRRRAEEEARKRHEDEVRRRAEEARKRAQEERKRREDDARRRAEEEERRRSEEARKRAEEERRRHEDDARRRAEEEKKRREDDARRRAAGAEDMRSKAEQYQSARSAAELAGERGAYGIWTSGTAAAYKLFDLSQTATPEEIKKRYKILILQNHTDKHPGEEAVYNEIIKSINNAYSVIKEYKGMN